VVAARHVTLIGLMGSGKTTIGRRVAELLDRSLIDSDEELARVTGGRTAADIERSDGLERLHEIEEEIAVVALSSPHPAVIGPAASTCESDAVRRLLEDAFVVWLTAPVPYLADSARQLDHRPLVERPDLEDVACRCPAS
jgi:shikimate kinase